MIPYRSRSEREEGDRLAEKEALLEKARVALLVRTLWRSPSRWVDADSERREVLKNHILLLWLVMLVIVLAVVIGVGLS